MNKVFSKEDSVIAVVDIQENLSRTMPEREIVLRNTSKMLKAAECMGIPVILTEQYPKGLGHTEPDILKLIPQCNPIEKLDFSCSGEFGFGEALRNSGKRQVILTGIETHICILQTAFDLLADGYQVGIVADAVCSFKQEDKERAFRRLENAGVVILTTEMVIYELLKKSGTAEFKALLPVLKDR